jgi:hypothetical protein
MCFGGPDHSQHIFGVKRADSARTLALNLWDKWPMHVRRRADKLTLQRKPLK